MLTSTLAAVLVAAAGCGSGGTAHELDLTATGYLQPGTEFWDGWTVPAGTVGLATPFPEPDPEPVKGMPRDTDRVRMDFLVTGDANEVMRDLHAQINRRRLRPVVPEESVNRLRLSPLVPEESATMCEERDRAYACELYGQGEDGLTKLTAELMVDPSPKRGEVSARLWITLGEYDDFHDGRWGTPTTWVDAAAPEGKAPVSVPPIEPDALVPGAKLPFFGTERFEGKEETIGAVPEGSRLLAPPYNASATYGFAGIFVITDRHDEALAELEAMATKEGAGDRHPEETLTAGDLSARRVAFEGGGGGCGVELDSVDLGSDVVAVEFAIFCD